jgi:hypothetical protein
LAVTVFILVLAAFELPALADDYDVVLISCGPCMTVMNAFVRADADQRGMWVSGTTGGDPGTPLDDGKRLLYGYNAQGNGLVGTSFSTVRVSAGGWYTDSVSSSSTQYGRTSTGLCPPNCTAACPPVCDEVLSVWDLPVAGGGEIVVTQTLRLAENPFSGRDDVVHFEYSSENRSAGSVAVGMRALLDVRVGDNDGAPYIIPGVGAVSTERSFEGDQVPAFWLAFESPFYEPTQLRALGILQGQGLSRPDEFVIAKWGQIQKTRWDYVVDPNESVTNDSAVALYWMPQPVGPGEVRTVRSAYGVAGDRGGRAFLSSPLEADCEPFTVVLFVSNFELDPLVNGQATIALPAGLALKAGESATKNLGTVAPGDTASVVWTVLATGGTVGDRTITASAAFAGGRRFTAEADVTIDCPAPPTLTPTASPTATRTPRPSATFTATPRDTSTPFPTATPGGVRACPGLVGRVPAAAISVALADPQIVNGYNLLCNPSRPEDPFNHYRRSLSIRNPGAPYHPVSNPLVFKCGCS